MEPRTRPPAESLQRDLRCRRDLRPDRARRPLGVPGAPRHDGARDGLVARAADGDRVGGPGARATLVRARAPDLRRTDRRARPPLGGDDVDLRVRTPCALARRARAAAAGVRPPEQAHARVARIGRRGVRDRDRPPARDGVPDQPGDVPREPLQLRRPPRLHRGTAAVIRLRSDEAGAPARPFRVPLNIHVRGVPLPLPSLVGGAATTAIFVVAMVTHIGARYGGPVWLAAGVVVYLVVRRKQGATVEARPPADRARMPPQAEFTRSSSR